MLGTRRLWSLFCATPKTNYYKLFDLPINFTQEQLKSSYLQLVKQYHPDLSKEPDAINKFREIQKGYEVLSDPAQRNKHQKQFQATPGQTQKQCVIDEFVDKFYNKFERKDQVNDQYNFSYKMFKEHYDKIQNPKKNYIRYEGQAGDQYYAHKQEKGESPWKPVLAASAACGVVGLAFFITNY